VSIVVETTIEARIENALCEAMSHLRFGNDSYSGIRAAVLGAAGFIGRWVSRSLCGQGAQLYLVVRDRASAERIFSEYEVRGEIIELDLEQPEAVLKLFQQIKPSITFNMAGYGVDRSERDEETAYRINAGLVEILCEALAEARDPEWAGQDVIHAGSALEYGEISGDLDEDSLPQPTTLYGKTKLAGTQALTRYCHTCKIKGVTARLFTVYGPGEHAGRLLPSLLDAASDRQPLQLTDGLQRRDFTYVADVAEGLLRLGLSQPAPGEIVNLATGRLTTVRQFVEFAANILNIPEEKLLFGALPTRREEMNHAPVTLNRLRRLTSWAPPTSIPDGICGTFEFESRITAQQKQ
jgi:nucleoside-diphosphate-sugar epimerase